MSRALRMLAPVALVAASLSATPAQAGSPSAWCSGGAPAPCIVSVTKGATPIASTDPVWQVQLEVFEPTHDIRWTLLQSGSDDLGPAAADTWTVVVDTGTQIPRVVYGMGHGGNVVRTDDGDGTYQVTASAQPVLVPGECDMSDTPWVCPEVATSEKTRLSAEIIDEHQWLDPVQRTAFYGVNFWTNVETNSFPANVIHREATDTYEMHLDFGAPHYLMDGSTVFHGQFEMQLPNDFLREHFFIPDPATMTEASLTVSGGGPISSTTVSKPSASAPIDIRVSDMTFSTRKLRVATGVLVPTRPGHLVARRTTSRAGTLSYDLAKARGARVTGYQAACVPAHGDAVKGSVKGNASPLKVTGLRSGTSYDCRVRASSRAGHGPWSASDRLAARP